MSMEVLFCNQQQAVEIPESWLSGLRALAPVSVQQALEHSLSENSPLHQLTELEVTLVEDATSDRVHREFMDVKGATDVITFHHGEIVIGAEVAERQAREFGEPLLRELYRYFVHGLLHLAGHEDRDNVARKTMEAAQESMVTNGWNSILSTLMT